jgi:hypothetical protein
MVKTIMTAAIGVVALTVGARAEDKPLGPHSYIIFCGIVPGTCTWVNGEWPQRVPLPRRRPRMEIPATETGKG